MGVGSPEGQLGYPETGEEVKSKLDEATLQEIARITDGEYYRNSWRRRNSADFENASMKAESTRRGKKVTILKEQYYLWHFGDYLINDRKFYNFRKRKRVLCHEKSTSTKTRRNIIIIIAVILALLILN